MLAWDLNLALYSSTVVVLALVAPRGSSSVRVLSNHLFSRSLFFGTRNEGSRSGSRQRHHSCLPWEKRHVMIDFITTTLQTVVSRKYVVYL